LPMKIEPRIRTSLAAALACVLLPSILVSSGGARTVRQKKQAARIQFEAAERLHDALRETPESARSHRDFQKVIEAYRKVYYTAPTSSKADEAVLAVAELLDEQGRALNDEKSYKDSIGQIRFLLHEYPGTRHRVNALFTIGQIYRDDLRDLDHAQSAFQDFLKRYPHSKLADQARKELVEIGDAAVGGNPFKRKSAHKQRSEPEPKAAWADAEPARPAQKKTVASRRKPDATKSPDDGPAPQAAAASQHAQNVSLEKPEAANPMSRLTSIRHWSTPDYVRVAIDLDQKVKYQAGRVPHPDRIFFDLYDTRLASDLSSKFEVEAGFLHRIRVAQYRPNMARVVLDVDDVAEYSAFLLPNPYRLIIDVHGKLPATPTQVASKKEVKPGGDEKPPLTDNAAQPEQNDVTITQVKPAQSARHREDAASALQRAEATRPGPMKKKAAHASTTETARLDPPKIVVDDAPTDTSDTPDTNKATSKPTSGPTYQAVAPRQSSRAKKRKKGAATADNRMPAITSHVASPTANGDRSLIRALGLKIGKIVVDAGHGGHDTGTIGPNGLEEKDLVLDVAMKLGKLLEKRLGAEVVYTRSDDTFVPLETRTAIANKEQADLFISIHANSSSDSSARGVETYYLNFTSSRDALEVAARENAVSEKSIHELQDLVKKIALKEKIEESREFATDVQKSLYAGLNARNSGLRNRGVKKAPFIVLIGANMPSILAEISFVSNPRDEKKLKTNQYRQRIAESLYKGVAKYIDGLSGVKLASRADRDEVRNTAAVAAK
jgi:N-acetylmuramoyl-L-alanine amidase